MGLREKALNYKKELNMQGKTTLLDKIAGPAETAFTENKSMDSAENNNDFKNIEIETPDSIGNSLDESLDQEIIDVEKSVTESEADPIEINGIDLPTIEINDDIFELPDEAEIVDDFEEMIAEAEEDKEGLYSEESDAIESEEGFVPSEDDMSSEIEEFEIKDDLAEPANINLPSDEMTFNPNPPEIDTGYGTKLYNAVPGNMLADKKYQDLLVLNEVILGFNRLDDLDSLYEEILFVIMGQIGVSNAVIAIARNDELVIEKVRGSGLSHESLAESFSRGILAKAINEHNIIDVSLYKDKKDFFEDFIRLSKSDIRIMLPLIGRNQVLGAILLGNKIAIGDYTSGELEFLNNIGSAIASQLDKLIRISLLNNELSELQEKNNFFAELSHLQGSLEKSISFNDKLAIIREELTERNARDFTLFLLDQNDLAYKVIVTDSRDWLLFHENNFQIANSAMLVDILRDRDFYYANPRDERTVTQLFDEKLIRQMKFLQGVGFRFQGELLGFALIYDGDLTDSAVDNEKLASVIKLVYENHLIEKNYSSNYASYIDNLATSFSRIDRIIKNAANVNIPVTLVMLSMKNYKRYCNQFGEAAAFKLLYTAKRIVIDKLSEGDFAFRYDRSKILIVLNGKNKKYANTFVNIIKSEIMQTYTVKEFQLLLTFLASEFPEEGSSVDALFDLLD